MLPSCIGPDSRFTIFFLNPRKGLSTAHETPVNLPLRSLLEMRSAAFSDCSERFFSSSSTSRGLDAS